MNDREKPSVTRLPEAKRDPALSSRSVLGDVPRQQAADQAPEYSDDEELEAVNPEHHAELMLSYDDDFVVWSERQAELLRRRAAGELVNDAEIDWPNVAEEIESVGRSERRELRSRLTRLLQHLLKWRYQPDHRSRSWRTTISGQRRDLEALLKDSPSLRATLADALTDAYPAARADAMTETGLLDLPQTSPFTIEQALNDPLADD
jgi:hypothetical protein